MIDSRQVLTGGCTYEPILLPVRRSLTITLPNSSSPATCRLLCCAPRAGSRLKAHTASVPAVAVTRIDRRSHILATRERGGRIFCSDQTYVSTTMADMSSDPDVASTYAEMLEARQLLADIEFVSRHFSNMNKAGGH